MKYSELYLLMLLKFKTLLLYYNLFEYDHMTVFSVVLKNNENNRLGLPFFEHKNNL